MAGAPAQIAYRFDRGLCIGQGVSDGLVLDDRVNAAALFSAGKMKHKLECRTHQRDAEDADKCGGRRERSGRQRKSRSRLSEQVVAGCRDVLETEFRNEVRAMPDCVD